MTDLATQIRTYLDDTAPAVEFEEIFIRPAPVREGQDAYPRAVTQPGQPRARRIQWALVAVVLVIVLVGGAALLTRSGSEGEPAAPTTITTTATSEDTQPRLDQIPLTILTEAVTPSSIGDVRWTVYRGDPESVAAMASEVSGPDTDDSSVIAPIFSADRIVTQATSSWRGTVGETTLSEWSVSVDWIETVLLHADENLVERSDNGRLLATYPHEQGIVEIALFTNEDQVGHYRNGREDISGPPLEIVARYDLSVFEDGDGSLLEVSDGLSGAGIGSVSSAFPFDGGRTELWALSTEGAVEVVEYPWPDHDNDADLVETADGFVAARHIGDHDSPFRMEVWQSPDGRSWQNVGLASSPNSGDPNSFAERDGVMMVSFGYTDDVSTYGILRSDDGINWVPPSVPPVPTGDDLVDEFGNVHFNATGQVYSLSSGWAWLSGPQTDFAFWTSQDGDVWEQVDTSGIPVPFWAQLQLPDPDVQSSSGSGREWSSGDTLFISQDREINGRQEPSTVWMIQLGP